MNKGDLIEFGRYPQGENGEVEPLEWKVIAAGKERALLLTAKAVDCYPFNAKCMGVLWEDCDLRKWLNDDFLRTAFTLGERSSILTVKNINRGDKKHLIPNGNDTMDKVFCLSVDEVLKYLPEEKDRFARATKYTRSKGAYVARNRDTWWRLRSNGYYGDVSATVSCYGVINYRVAYVHLCKYAVRPAIWVKTTLVSP